MDAVEHLAPLHDPLRATGLQGGDLVAPAGAVDPREGKTWVATAQR